MSYRDYLKWAKRRDCLALRLAFVAYLLRSTLRAAS